MSALLDRALAPVRLSREARNGSRRENTGAQISRGHRLRDVHARRGLHRFRRRSPGLARGGRGDGGRHGSVLAASTEIGQGTNTVFSQIVADALGIDVDVRRGRAARHRPVPEQRPDRRLAHVHGRRQAGRVGGARSQGHARAAGLLPAASLAGTFRAACARLRGGARAAACLGAIRAARRRAMGRRAIPGRRVRRRTRGPCTSPR